MTDVCRASGHALGMSKFIDVIEVGRFVSDMKKPADQVNELKDLVVGYAKQEAVDPLKNLGRYLRFGASGALLIGIGALFLLLALLRGLQSIDIFADDNPAQPGLASLAPYGITVLAGALLLVFAAVRIKNGERDQRGDSR